MGTGDQTCTSCGTLKTAKFFSPHKRECTDCRVGKYRDRKNSGVEPFLQSKLSALKQRHRKKEYEGNPVDLKYLIDLYEAQRGICALSGIPMHVTSENSELSASPDRIDIDQGYVEGNIRLVCSRMNLIRNSLSDRNLLWWCRAVVNNNGN